MNQSKNKTYLILLILAGIVFSSTFFWASFHNIDLSHNALKLSYLSKDLDYYSLRDSVLGEEISMDGLYNFGIETMEFAFLISIVLNVAFVLYLYLEKGKNGATEQSQD